MSASLPDWVGRYAAIAVGLLLGEAAKYGLALTDNEKLTWRGLFADALMLGFLGLIAVLITDQLNITNTNFRVFVAAICALLSARLVRIVRDRMQAKARAEIDRLLRNAPAIGEALRTAHPLPDDEFPLP